MFSSFLYFQRRVRTFSKNGLYPTVRIFNANFASPIMKAIGLYLKGDEEL